MNGSDPFNLERFVVAQNFLYDAALAEIRSGHKRSHWMWFMFPQFRGLGNSARSVKYAINSATEAKAYLAHPVLGPRLLAIAKAALEIQGLSARQIFGAPDDLKLQSCMTLFAHISENESVFQALLNKYFDGQADRHTLTLLHSL